MLATRFVRVRVRVRVRVKVKVSVSVSVVESALVACDEVS